MHPIPANATRIRYLESDGSQWVDTGVVPQIPDDLTCSAGVLWPDTTTRKIMGRQGSFYFGPVNGYLQAGQGSSANTGVSLAANTKYDITIRFVPTAVDATDKCYYSVGAISGNATVWYLHTPSSSSPFWIFNANDASTLRGASRVYYFQISRNGTVLRDFIPVRVGQTGYLFDRVSGQLFGNAGTGDFVLGPDTFSQGVVPTRMMAMGVRKKLPYDAEVEYLYRSESDVNTGPFIITDVLLANNPIIEMSIMPDAGSVFCWVAGARRFNSPSAYCNMATNAADGKVRAVYGGGTAREATFSLSTSSFSTIKMTKDALFVNGVSVKTYSGTVGTQFSSSGEPKCGIFTLVQTGGATPIASGGPVKIAWCKIWNDNGATLVFDGRAVRKGTTGYLYDSVSGNLYGNAASSGAFVLGLDK